MFRPYFLKNNNLSSFFGLAFIICLAILFTNISSVIFIVLFNICSSDIILPFNFVTLGIGSLIQFFIIAVILKFSK